MPITILKDTKLQELILSSNYIEVLEDLILSDYRMMLDAKLANAPRFEYDQFTGVLNIIMPGYSGPISTEAPTEPPTEEPSEEPTIAPPKLEYFWIENLEDTAGEVVFTLEGSSNTKPATFEYSTNNGGTWTEFSTSTVTSSSQLRLEIPSNGIMYLKGDNTSFGVSHETGTKISCTKRHNIGGKLVSLLSKNLVEPNTLQTDCFACLFRDNSKLEDASELIMLNKNIDYCYTYMFYGCTSLVRTPILPTKISPRCFLYMFYGCTSLTTAPALPATTLANNCYQYMFAYCTSLTNVPELPATKTVQRCYGNMFEGCTSLTTAPELPATTLKEWCYEAMFKGCTSLTTAPELPATALGKCCYRYMFQNCTNLNYVKALFTSIGENSLTDWLKNVAASGKFVKNSSSTLADSDLKVPSGWTITTVV